MNLPNKLTVFRAVLVIPFVVVLLGRHAGWLGLSGASSNAIALTIFVVASLTDWLDGRLARKRGLITDFGKFLDPIADKLLVCSALIALVELGRIPAWVVIIIIGRELAMSGFRLIALNNGMVLAASGWGKAKTVVQIVMICLMLIDLPMLLSLTQVMIWVVLALTVISLADYIIKNKRVLSCGCCV